MSEPEKNELDDLLDKMVEDFRYTLNHYLDLLEERLNFHLDKAWKDAMVIYRKWFEGE